MATTVKTTSGTSIAVAHVAGFEFAAEVLRDDGASYNKLIVPELAVVDPVQFSNWIHEEVSNVSAFTALFTLGHTRQIDVDTGVLEGSTDDQRFVCRIRCGNDVTVTTASAVRGLCKKACADIFLRLAREEFGWSIPPYLHEPELYVDQRIFAILSSQATKKRVTLGYKLARVEGAWVAMFRLNSVYVRAMHKYRTFALLRAAVGAFFELTRTRFNPIPVLVGEQVKMVGRLWTTSIVIPAKPENAKDLARREAELK